jgi:hypothetical protein
MRKRKDSPPPDGRAQALSPEISLRAPIVEGAQAPTPELSLRAVGQDASSWMASPLSIKVVMKGGSEEIIVLGLGPPQVNALEIGALEISAQAQGAPTTTQGINTMEAAAASALPPSKIRLFPKETRPFNYARLEKNEAPHLHILSSGQHMSDDALAGNERTGDNANGEAPFETEQYAPSSDGSDLGDEMDRLLNGGMPLTHDHCGNNNVDPYDDGSTLVDFEEKEPNSDDGFRVNMD